MGNSLDSSEAIESAEIMYKKGLSAAAPSQLSKFRDAYVPVGDSKIRAALSKLKRWCDVRSP